MKTTRTVKCQEPGCGEYAHYSYDTRKEAREADLRRVKFPYKCSRHSDPDRNLSRERLEVSREFVNRTVMRSSVPTEVLGMFWDGHFGLLSDMAFRAEADDFPEGTKLVITARIELPEAVEGEKV